MLAVSAIRQVGRTIFVQPSKRRIGRHQLMTQRQRPAIQGEHRIGLCALTVGSEISEPCGLRQMRGFRRLPRLIGGHAGAFDFHAGREAERPLDPIGGDPRQRDAAPIAALVLGRTFTVARGRILKLVPRDVSDLEQAELLTLI